MDHEADLDIEQAAEFLRFVVRRYVGVSNADADDIASTVILTLLSGPRTHWSKGYLAVAAKNATFRWIARGRSSSDFGTASARSDPQSAQAYQDVDTRLQFGLDLGQFSPGDQAFLWDVFDAAMNGTEDRELAARMNIPTSTFSYRKVRLLSRLFSLREEGRID